jgi:hypothetical protein
MADVGSDAPCRARLPQALVYWVGTGAGRGGLTDRTVAWIGGGEPPLALIRVKIPLPHSG